MSVISIKKTNKSFVSHATNTTLSNYCLKLQENEVATLNGSESPVSNGSVNNNTTKVVTCTYKNYVYPLSIGLNKIGRSDSSQICILNKVNNTNLLVFSILLKAGPYYFYEFFNINYEIASFFLRLYMHNKINNHA